MYEENKMTECRQTIIIVDKQSLVSYQIPIPSAPNKHNILYQSPLKGISQIILLLIIVLSKSSASSTSKVNFEKKVKTIYVPTCST